MKTKYIFALVLIVILGLWSNKLKRFAMLSPNGARLSRLDINAMNYEMYRRSNLENDSDAVRAKAKPFRLAGAGTFKKDELFGGLKVKPVAKAQTKAEKEKEKKKKKKKKLAELARLKKELEYKTIVYKEALRKKALAEASAASTYSYGPVAQPVKPDNKDAEDLAKWNSLLLGRPDKEAVALFIREYQNNMISETVYYTIIDRMYAERDSEFKSLAVLAAGSISALRSFDFLFKALSDREAGSEVTAQANSELQEYASLTSVPILRQVILSHLDDATKIEIAIRALDASTAFYLTPKAANAEGSAVDQEERTPATNAKTEIFATFIEPLDTVIKNYASNSAIAVPANRTLTRIKAVTNTLAQNNNE